ncbi:MAG: hypothetical protein ACTSRZ_14150 [Promethearchaeota archaeon]
MKIFETENGKIFQLADEEMINRWEVEMPLLFVGYIKDKKLDSYPKSIRKDVENYLNEILEKIAIPKIIEVIKGENIEKKFKVAENLIELSKSNPEQLKYAIKFVEEASKDKNKKFAKLMNEVIKNYKRYQLQKKNAEKRKKLNQLRKKMDKLDVLLAQGKISDEEYLIEQKKFLKLKLEIEKSEKI